MVNKNNYLPLGELFTINNKYLTLMKIFTQELCCEYMKLETSNFNSIFNCYHKWASMNAFIDFILKIYS